MNGFCRPRLQCGSCNWAHMVTQVDDVMEKVEKVFIIAAGLRSWMEINGGPTEDSSIWNTNRAPMDSLLHLLFLCCCCFNFFSKLCYWKVGRYVSVTAELALNPFLSRMTVIYLEPIVFNQVSFFVNLISNTCKQIFEFLI